MSPSVSGPPFDPTGLETTVVADADELHAQNDPTNLSIGSEFYLSADEGIDFVKVGESNFA